MKKIKTISSALFFIIGLCLLLSGVNNRLNSQSFEIGPFHKAERYQIHPCPGDYPGFKVRCTWGRGLCDAGDQINCPGGIQ